MGWFTNLLGRFGPSDSLNSPGGWLVRIIGGKSSSGITVSEHSALYLPIVYACINRIANPIASFPTRIYQNKNGKRVEVTEHPMSERLRLRPNDYMSARTLAKVNMLHALSWGNGYQEIERNRSGEAVGLWPLLPDRTRPRKVDDRILIDTTIDGSKHKLDHSNVLHIMDQSQCGYVGLSQVALAREAMALSLAMEKFGASFFANEAKSGGFLMHPGRLGANAVNNLRGQDGKPKAGENPATRLEKQGGLDNAHRVKVLEEGMKFISTTIPPEDAQFLGSREFQIAEIARIYDVPLILVQSHEKSTSWGSGIEQLMIGFVRQTIAPWVEAREQEMNWKLFTEREREQGLYVKSSMQALLRGDMAARAAFYKSLFEVGALSPDEIAELEEMEGVGGNGAKRFVPVNFVPIDRAGQSPLGAGGTTE